MKKYLFGVALFTCLVAMGGIASAQTIDEIQVYEAGVPASPYAGQVVSVTGVIFERGQFSGGSHYLLGDTGGISMYQGSSPVNIGDMVTATGTVGEFGGEIQLGSVSFNLISSGNSVTPTPMTITEVLSTYENVGNFASVIGTVTEVAAPGNFFFTDGNDTLQVYIDSTTGIDLGAVEVGDEYMVTSPIVNYNTTIELKPRFQTDLVENPGGDTLPQIADVNCVNWVPMTDDAITVQAAITDDSAVVSANLYYRDSDGETPGSWMSVPMIVTSGDIFAGTIPAPHTMSLVDFYLDATDDGAQTVTLPGDAPASFTTVAVGITSIYEMQYVHPDSNNQDCPYNGKFLNIRGVVTAGTNGEVGSPSKFVVQEQDVEFYSRTYAFGGTLVYESSASGEYYRGDLVEIGGMGNDYYGLSQILPHNGDAINMLDFGVDLPVPSRVATRILADDHHQDGTGALGEAWENVWIKTFPSQVAEYDPEYGDYKVFDKYSAGLDTVPVSPIVELTYVPTVDDIITIEGYMSYDYGNFTVVPISDEFIVQVEDLSAADDTPTIVKAGGFKSIAPNPFNPSAKISFVVNKDNLVQLNVYNIRGEKIRTLVQDRLPQSEYSFTWDGKNDAGQSVASGNYFARLRIGAEVMQVRKMSLVK